MSIGHAVHHLSFSLTLSLVPDMLLLTLLSLLHGVSALPAAQNAAAASCSYDGLYTSLSKDGGDFCSSMVKTPCEVSVTPTQFTSYPSDKLSSYVSPLPSPPMLLTLSFVILRKGWLMMVLFVCLVCVPRDDWYCLWDGDTYSHRRQRWEHSDGWKRW